MEVPNYVINDIKNKTTSEAIDKTSARISRLFHQTWLSRYPRPKRVVFDNGSEFKKDFVPLLKDWSINPKCTTIINSTSNSPVERIHQVLRHNFLTKTQIFYCINPFGDILASVPWALRASYNSATDATPAQLVFGRYMLFNLCDHTKTQPHGELHTTEPNKIDCSHSPPTTCSLLHTVSRRLSKFPLLFTLASVRPLSIKN